MKHRWLVQFGLIAIALSALTTPVFAGGWAVVTLDTLPAEPRAGQTLHLGFMVRQHGVRPVEGSFVKPYLSATNKDTGAALRAEARQEGPVGHFVVDVTFPSGGTWEWQITPAPFAATKLGQLSVLPAAVAPAAAPATAGEKTLAPAAAPAAVGEKSVGPAVSPLALRWLGGLLLIAAAALSLAGRRGILMRRPALGSR